MAPESEERVPGVEGMVEAREWLVPAVEDGFGSPPARADGKVEGWRGG